MILRSKYQIAVNSVKERQIERYRDAIDEYYGFKNEFANSKYIKEANKIFEDSNSQVKDK